MSAGYRQSFGNVMTAIGLPILAFCFGNFSRCAALEANRLVCVGPLGIILNQHICYGFINECFSD